MNQDPAHQKLEALKKRLKDIYTIDSIVALLDWDRAVNLPTLASETRGQQIEHMMVLSHERLVDPKLAEIVNGLCQKLAALPVEEQVNVRETKRKIDRETKLPSSFVAEKSYVTSMAYAAWVEARPKNDFAAVLPHLEKIVDLCRKEADLVGYKEHPYDALVDVYEPGATIRLLKPMLTRLGEGLSKTIPPLTSRFAKIKSPQGSYSIEKQTALHHKILSALGFSFETGRLDKSPHPFSTCLGFNDWRITTRYKESDYLNALYSTLHEAGHAFYEMGLRKESWGLPMSTAISLGVHESQSRLWENLVGRSKEFVSYLHNLLGEFFPEEQKKTDVEMLWQQVNRIAPGLIRVDADEVTYALHIVIRMLLEESLITGELKPRDLPSAWNDLYKKYLGITPPNDKDGVMQDVHWYSGSIGYFPTYALGNLYGVPMLEAAKREMPELMNGIKNGKFSQLREWLTKNVHQHGMMYSGPELVKRISGQEVSEKPFLDYVRTKFNC